MALHLYNVNNIYCASMFVNSKKKNTYRLWCELLHPNLGLSNDQWPSNESMLQWLFWIRRFVTKTQAAERVWSNRPGKTHVAPRAD